jgi:hypothetical protein
MTMRRIYERYVLASGQCSSPEVILVWIGALLFCAMLISSIHQINEHERFLRQRGCQLLTKAPTGREVYCGKACFTAEHVYVYECADGTRTEIGD